MSVIISGPGAGGGPSFAPRAISQAGHGLSVGNWVYCSGVNTYAKADSDAASTSDVLGYVSAVADVDNFTLVSPFPFVSDLSGLTAGSAYFLSGTAGGITATEPSTVGQVTEPVLIAVNTTSGYLIGQRPIVVSATSDTYYHITIPPTRVPTAQSTWSTLYSPQQMVGFGVNNLLYGTIQAANTQNSYISYQVWIPAGTWTADFLQTKDSNLAIITMYIDDVSVGTVDQYAASNSVNNHQQITGIAVATSGLHTIKFQNATKNASSSAWYAEFQWFEMWRTA